MTRQFEELFARRHAVAHALATTSCTAALHLATAASRAGAGRRGGGAGLHLGHLGPLGGVRGARAVFADVDLRTFNLDPQALEAAITPRTKAVVVVHLFGLAACLDEILDIARRHSLAVIEDAACAVGTTYRGRPVGGLR